MDTNQLKEQVRKEFDEKFSKLGFNIVDYKDELFIKSSVRADDIKSFIDSIIDSTEKATKERIVKEIDFCKLRSDYKYDEGTINKIISIITNKSDLSSN